MRMLISTLPILVFGIAGILEKLTTVFSKTTIAFLYLIFILQNVLMILFFHLFLHNPTYVAGELSQTGKLKIAILTLLGSFFR